MTELQTIFEKHHGFNSECAIKIALAIGIKNLKGVDDKALKIRAYDLWQRYEELCIKKWVDNKTPDGIPPVAGHYEPSLLTVEMLWCGVEKPKEKCTCDGWQYYCKDSDNWEKSEARKCKQFDYCFSKTSSKYHQAKQKVWFDGWSVKKIFDRLCARDGTYAFFFDNQELLDEATGNTIGRNLNLHDFMRETNSIPNPQFFKALTL